MLIVIDPISAYLRGIDGNNNVDVRQVLLELAAIAREQRAAMLLVSHQRKEWSQSVLHRAIGSLAFTAVARPGLMLAEDPAVSGRRLLLPVKMTLQRGGEGRALRISEGRVEWEEETVPMTGDELQHLARTGLGAVDARREAAEWLKELLLEKRVRSTEVVRLARAKQISHNVLWDAKKLAGVRVKKDGKDGKWWWELPSPLDFEPVIPGWLKEFGG